MPEEKKEKSRIEQALDLIRDEAVGRMKPGSDYPALLCGVALELDAFIYLEMSEFRLAERSEKNHSPYRKRA